MDSSFSKDFAIVLNSITLIRFLSVPSNFKAGVSWGSYFDLEKSILPSGGFASGSMVTRNVKPPPYWVVVLNLSKLTLTPLNPSLVIESITLPFISTLVGCGAISSLTTVGIVNQLLVSFSLPVGV